MSPDGCEWMRLKQLLRLGLESASGMDQTLKAINRSWQIGPELCLRLTFETWIIFQINCLNRMMAPTILKIRSQITDNFFNQIRLHWIGSLDLMNASWIQPSNPWSRIKSRFALDQPKNYWTMLTGWKGWHGRSHSKWPPWRWLLWSSLSVYGAIWVRIRGYALSGRSRNKQKQRRLGHQTRPGCCFWWGVPIFQRVMI